MGQEFIKGEPAYSSLSITAQGKQLLRGKAQPTLIQPVITTQKKKAVEKTKQKMKSEEWSKEALDPKWGELIEKSLLWRKQHQIDEETLIQTKEFVKEILSRYAS